VHIAEVYITSLVCKEASRIRVNRISKRQRKTHVWPNYSLP